MQIEDARRISRVKSAGKLPIGAITEWLVADRVSDEVVYEWNDKRRMYMNPRKVAVHNQRANTNLQWCEAEMIRINRARPRDPVYIHRSQRDPTCICLCRVSKPSNEAAEVPHE